MDPGFPRPGMFQLEFERLHKINTLLKVIHDLELFAIKYGKIHFTANNNTVRIQHNLFGEFGALFDESVFCHFQLNIHKFTSSFIFTILR